MYSVYQEPLIARGKALLNQFGFDAPPNKTAAVDVHKPVFVPAFSDTLEEIGLTGASRSTAAVDSHRNAMEVFYSALGEHFKQEVCCTPITYPKESVQADGQTPAKNADDELRQFAEPQLDAAIEERYRVRNPPKKNTRVAFRNWSSLPANSVLVIPLINVVAECPFVPLNKIESIVRRLFLDC